MSRGLYERNRAQGADGVDSARAEKDKSGLVASTVLEKVQGADQVVLDDLAWGRRAVHTRQDRRVRSGVDDPICRRKSVEITRASQITMHDSDASCAKTIPICLAAWPPEVVKPENRDVAQVFSDLEGQSCADKAARSGDQQSHGGILSVRSTDRRGVHLIEDIVQSLGDRP